MNGITAFALSDPIARLLGEWSMGLNTYSIILRIAVAVIFASVIGCERSSKRHSAGLRTFVLISFASTVSMILDIYLMMSYSFSVPVLSAATIIGTAMVSGNSILFSSRNQIKGLTTSAGLWACGILGFTIGAGLYTVTVIVYVSCSASSPASRRLRYTSRTARTTLRSTSSSRAANIFRTSSRSSAASD